MLHEKLLYLQQTLHHVEAGSKRCAAGAGDTLSCSRSRGVNNMDKRLHIKFEGHPAVSSPQ
jgi:hypothetical protein